MDSLQERLWPCPVTVLLSIIHQRADLCTFLKTFDQRLPSDLSIEVKSARGLDSRSGISVVGLQP